MSFFYWKNLKIHYVYENENTNTPLVLFFHGFNDSLSTFNPILKLNRNFRFAAIDFPGCGLSEFKNNQINLEQYFKVASEFVNTILQHEKNIIVVGHSLGGASALFLNDIKSIKHTILLSPINEFLLKYKDTKSLKEKLLPLTVNQCINSYESLFAILTERISKIASFTCSKRANQFQNVYNKFFYLVEFNILNENYLSNNLARLYFQKQNITIISGENDLYTTKEEILSVQEKYQIPVILLKQTGHAIIFEQPKEILKLIEEKIKQ
ncbi:alpha/beta fold hydrolase [Mycoplasmopsis cricetuli]|uniref:alpha/beta fold hydrolase n=1 Tax=Mycoplasmopsis cricetuli TaxID=171283 RepID=UPI00046F2EA6|nr:alpha/beta hydrolase [Mycoplasmopsis cricetuli]